MKGVLLLNRLAMASRLNMIAKQLLKVVLLLAVLVLVSRLSASPLPAIATQLPRSPAPPVQTQVDFPEAETDDAPPLTEQEEIQRLRAEARLILGQLSGPDAPKVRSLEAILMEAFDVLESFCSTPPERHLAGGSDTPAMPEPDLTVHMVSAPDHGNDVIDDVIDDEVDDPGNEIAGPVDEIDSQVDEIDSLVDGESDIETGVETTVEQVDDDGDDILGIIIDALRRLADQLDERREGGQGS